MVTPISEDDARRELRLQNSAASNPEYYGATRLDQGWLFGWRKELGPTPMGTRPWVVADNGHSRMLDLRDRAERVIETLLGQESASDG